MSGGFLLLCKSKRQTCQQYSWRLFLSAYRQDFVPSLWWDGRLDIPPEPTCIRRGDPAGARVKARACPTAERHGLDACEEGRQDRPRLRGWVFPYPDTRTTLKTPPNGR